MAEIIGVRFRSAGKVYFFDPNGQQVKKGDYVVVETARGAECGEVAVANQQMEDSSIRKQLKPLVRVATEADVRKMNENHKKQAEAMAVCQKRIAAHKLDMKLVDAEYAFDNSKILFYFTADGRVDFRDLVKDLASVFHARIELRQIGVRDEAKMLGGLGICGQPFCCAQFLSDFQPVSIKMAKEQGLSLNPTKISGSCGRLMCCLKYEQDAYESLIKITPKVGAIVNTPEGRGVVTEANLLTGALKIRLDKAEDSPCTVMTREDVTVIKDGRGRLPRERNTDAPAGRDAAPAPAPAKGAPAKGSPAKGAPAKSSPAKNKPAKDAPHKDAMPQNNS